MIKLDEDESEVEDQGIEGGLEGFYKLLGSAEID
jgi:hypothetical protein